MSDDRRSAPHVARNAEPIAEVLRDVLPARGLVLEVASGTGEHVLHFARAFPKLLWQPSDPEPAALRSIEAWRAEAGLFNLLPPVSLDARAADWPVARGRRDPVHQHGPYQPLGGDRGADARRRAAAGAQGAPLYLYGAYRQAGVETAPSNEAFDESLRARDPEWGVRDLEEVVAEAEKHGLRLDGGDADAGEQSVGGASEGLSASPPDGRQAEHQQQSRTGRRPSRRSRRSASGRRASTRLSPTSSASQTARPDGERARARRSRGSSKARQSQTSVALAAWPLGKA